MDIPGGVCPLRVSPHSQNGSARISASAIDTFDGCWQRRKNQVEHFRERELEQAPKQKKRDEAMWQACRIAHAILGLDEADECDPSGVQRRAALTALAHQFLHGAHRKPIPVIVRAKPLQQADIRGLYRIILMCFEMQFDQVFKSLADEARREALSLFTEQIADRYNGVKP